MAKYRKKPIVIDAILWDGSREACRQFESMAAETYHRSLIMRDGSIRFPTREGAISFPLGYMLIRGVEGEVYGCHPDIFAKTYELVEDQPDVIG